MSIFTGSAVAIVTPFKKDGSVDYDKFRDVIEYQIAGGTDCIVVCGTTGESSTLSHEEHLDCIRFCAEVVNKRIPVVAGTGSNCTETAIYLSQEAEKYGVDGLLVVTPYYNKATQKGLIAHYTAVANSVTVFKLLCMCIAFSICFRCNRKCHREKQNTRQYPCRYFVEFLT